MSWFSRKTIIVVSSVVYPMGPEPDKVPDMVKASVITAQLSHRPVQPAIKDCVLQGMGVKLSQAYAYARKNYYGGLPTSVPDTPKFNNGPVLDILSKEHLEQVFSPDVITLHDATITNETDYVSVISNLVADEFDYDFVQKKSLSTVGTVPVNSVLTTMEGIFDFVGHEGEVGYHLVFTKPDTSTVAFDRWYPDSYFEEAKIIQPRVIMYYSRNGGRAAVESYEDSGESPRLNVLLREFKNPYGGAFPCITLKKNNVYLTDNKFTGSDWHTSDAYKTSRTYARRLGLKLDDIIDLVKDNASEGDIDYCFIQPGVLLANPNQPPIEYKFNYFYRNFLSFPDNKPAVEAWAAECNYPTNGHDVVPPSKAYNCPVQSIRTYDPDAQSNTLDMAIGWRWMSYEEKTGTLDTPFEQECGDYEFYDARAGGTRAPPPNIYETTKLYLRKRLTETTYGELIICGLRHENYIYKGHTVESGCWSAFNEPDEDDGTGFMLPLDYNIYVSLSARERLQLAQEALHLVFNCYVAHKQKWYETDWFSTLLFLVVIIIIVFSWGTATPYVTSTYGALTAALIAAGVGATLAAALAAIITALIMAAISAAISYVAKEAGEWAAEKWGPAWGAVVQLVAVVALSYGIGSLGNLGGYFSALSAFSLTNSVLQVGNLLLTSMAAYTQYTYIALQKEITTFNEQTQGENNPLQQVTDLMAEMFPELEDIQKTLIMPKPEYLDEFLGRTLTSVDGLTSRLFLPVNSMVEMTLTPRL